MKEKNNIFYTLIGLILFIGIFGLVFGLYKEIDKAEAQETNNPFAGYVLSGYAWSENIGWISFNGPNYSVKVNDDKTLSGYAWSENIGWISFNASDLGGCPSAPCNAKISDDNKNITGWARAIRPKNPENQTLGGWEGWIKLSDLNKGYKLEITEITPNPNSSVKKYQISGFVWGGGGNSRDSAVIGWTSFKGDTYGVVIEPEPTESPICNNVPLITVSPSFQEGYRGNSLTYYLTITNSDQSNCSSSTFSSSFTETNSCLTYSSIPPQQISPQNSVKIPFTVTITDSCEEGRIYESKIKTINNDNNSSAETSFETKVKSPDHNCVRGTPSITVSPSSQEWKGEDLTYYLTITNKDFNCVASDFKVVLEEQGDNKCLTYYEEEFDIKISSGRSVSKDIIVKDASNCDKGTHTTNVTATNNLSQKSGNAWFDVVVTGSGEEEEEEELYVDFKCSRSKTGPYESCSNIGILWKDSALYLEDITSSIGNLVSRKWTLFDSEEKEVASCEIGRNSPNYCIISTNPEKAKVRVLLGRFKVKLEDTYKNESNNITYTGSNEYWFRGYIGGGGSWNEDSSF